MVDEDYTSKNIRWHLCLIKIEDPHGESFTRRMRSTRIENYMSQKKMLLIKKAIWLTGRRMLCNIISQWKYQDRRIDASQAEKEIFKQEIIWRKDIRSYVLWKHTSWVLLFNISHVLYWYTRFFNHSSRWKDIFANTMSHASRNMPCKEKESRQEIICLKRLTVSRKHTSHQSMSYKAYPSRIDIYCSWIIRLNKMSHFQI